MPLLVRVYLIRVPHLCSRLKRILFFLEVCVGVLWIDSMGVCLTSAEFELEAGLVKVCLRFGGYLHPYKRKIFQLNLI